MKLEGSPSHLAYLKGERKKKITVHVARCCILLFFLGLWELGAQLRWIDAFITSSPSRIVNTLIDLFVGGSLFYHIGVTLMETVCGFLLSLALGYLIAIGLWASEWARKILEPYIVVLNALPKIALGPLIIIWFGTGYDAIIFMTILVSIIVCIMNLLASFLAVDKNKILLLQSMGAGKGVLLKKLILPATFPALISTLKVAVGLSWIGSIMGEYIVSKAGLGYLIVYGGQVFQLDLVMTATVILCALAGGMYGLVALLQRRLLRGLEG